MKITFNPAVIATTEAPVRLPIPQAAATSKKLEGPNKPRPSRAERKRAWAAALAAKHQAKPRPLIVAKPEQAPEATPPLLQISLGRVSMPPGGVGHLITHTDPKLPAMRVHGLVLSSEQLGTLDVISFWVGLQNLMEGSKVGYPGDAFRPDQRSTPAFLLPTPTAMPGMSLEVCVLNTETSIASVTAYMLCTEITENKSTVGSVARDRADEMIRRRLPSHLLIP